MSRNLAQNPSLIEQGTDKMSEIGGEGPISNQIKLLSIRNFRRHTLHAFASPRLSGLFNPFRRAPGSAAGESAHFEPLGVNISGWGRGIRLVVSGVK